MGDRFTFLPTVEADAVTGILPGGSSGFAVLCWFVRLLFPFILTPRRRIAIMPGWLATCYVLIWNWFPSRE